MKEMKDYMVRVGIGFGSCNMRRDTIRTYVIQASTPRMAKMRAKCKYRGEMLEVMGHPCTYELLIEFI